jgi:hypothetical protein
LRLSVQRMLVGLYLNKFTKSKIWFLPRNLIGATKETYPPLTWHKLGIGTGFHWSFVQSNPYALYDHISSHVRPLPNQIDTHNRQDKNFL